MLSQHASASYAQQMGLHAEAGKVNQSNAHKDSSAQSEKLTVIFPCICTKKTEQSRRMVYLEQMKADWISVVDKMRCDSTATAFQSQNNFYVVAERTVQKLFHLVKVCDCNKSH